MKTKGMTSQTSNLLNHFESELRLHFREQHKVSYYAQKVCVTPRYLNQVVKQNYGVTAKEMIDRKLLVESMSLLSGSSMSVEEISHALSFPSQSYFGRFFKRLSGVSPLSYRRRSVLGTVEPFIV